VTHDARQEYLARLAALQAQRDALNKADARFAHARLMTFAAAVVLGLLAWRASVHAAWLIVPAAVFVWLVRRHDQTFRRRDHACRGIAFYERGLARIEDRWYGTGETGERFRGDRHVYAADLDLFGRGSLFELLSLARTRTGEEMLAHWLISPADRVEIVARQEAVEELAPDVALREQLALAGADVRAAVHTDRLLAWAETGMPPRRQLHLVTWSFTVAVLLAILYMAASSVWWPMAALVTLQAVGFRRFREGMNAIVSGTDPEASADFVADALTHRARDLDVLADLLKHLEARRFACGRLTTLRRGLAGEGRPASAIIRQLHRLSVFHDSERNSTIFPLGLFLLGQLELALSTGALLQLVRPHLALAVGRWRECHGARVRVWLEIVAQLEVLASLSGYRYEHAGDPFPEIIEPESGAARQAVLDGTQLGHPLLPAASMVRNDVHLAGGLQLLVVSGSNMSGKSTLLRTVGINAVLALAGAPVRADALRLTPVAIGATLRIQDSLIEGRSRFYAEITRIRQIADVAAGPVPLLFLLDELFHGTNSHDRLVGAEGVLRSLLDRGASGLITTHDLALTAVAAGLSPRAANVHFEDWMDGNEIKFDYLMKPGPVTRSNAIALMRAVGLDVAVS